MHQREATLLAELNETRAKLDRAETFLAAEPQIVIVWGLQSDEPDVQGDISLVSDVPVPRRILGFGSWLAPEQAQQLEGCVASLRQRGEGFRLAVHHPWRTPPRSRRSRCDRLRRRAHSGRVG